VQGVGMKRKKTKTAKVKLMNTAYLDFMRMINENSSKKGKDKVISPDVHEDIEIYNNQYVDDSPVHGSIFSNIK
jgi:hypothetical protein